MRHMPQEIVEQMASGAYVEFDCAFCQNPVRMPKTVAPTERQYIMHREPQCPDFEKSTPEEFIRLNVDKVGIEGLRLRPVNVQAT